MGGIAELPGRPFFVGLFVLAVAVTSAAGSAAAESLRQLRDDHYGHKANHLYYEQTFKNIDKELKEYEAPKARFKKIVDENKAEIERVEARLAAISALPKPTREQRDEKVGLEKKRDALTRSTNNAQSKINEIDYATSELRSRWVIASGNLEKSNAKLEELEKKLDREERKAERHLSLFGVVAKSAAFVRLLQEEAQAGVPRLTANDYTSEAGALSTTQIDKEREQIEARGQYRDIQELRRLLISTGEQLFAHLKQAVARQSIDAPEPQVRVLRLQADNEIEAVRRQYTQAVQAENIPQASRLDRLLEKAKQAFLRLLK